MIFENHSTCCCERKLMLGAKIKVDKLHLGDRRAVASEPHKTRTHFAENFFFSEPGFALLLDATFGDDDN